MKSILNKLISISGLFALILFITISFSSCSKQVNTSTTPTPTPVDTTHNSTTSPAIKFFNVMDYGRVDVYMNGSWTDSINKYYTSGYHPVKIGTNTIKLIFPTNTSNNLIYSSVDLTAGNYYSCFFYKVGNEWKYEIIKDDVTAPTATQSKFRVLDFRTQAYFNYVNVRVHSGGYGDVTLYDRNFLDQATYDSKSSFYTVDAAPYSVTVFKNDSTYVERNGYTFSGGKIYSIILTTPSQLAPGVATKYIYPDIQIHN